MAKRKTEPIEVRCEGDIEAVVELFCGLAEKKSKRKELSIMFPTEMLSLVFLNIAHSEWVKRGLTIHKDFLLKLIVLEQEKDNDET
jgi:hypothetical protein